MNRYVAKKMNPKDYKKRINILLCLFLIVELFFQIGKETDWLNDIEYLKFSLQYARAIIAFLFFFMGLYAQINKKSYDQKFEASKMLIFIGIVFSALSVSPAISSLYFLNRINLSLLPTEELSKVNAYVGLAKGFIRDLGILFLVFLFGFIYYLKNMNKQHNHQMKADEN